MYTAKLSQKSLAISKPLFKKRNTNVIKNEEDPTSQRQNMKPPSPIADDESVFGEIPEQSPLLKSAFNSHKKLEEKM